MRASTSINKEIELRLFLSEAEAVALKEMMQNPLRQDESEDEREVRMTIFSELAGVVV